MIKTYGKKIAQRFLTFSKKNCKKLKLPNTAWSSSSMDKTQQPPMETQEISAIALHIITDSSQACTAEYYFTTWTQTITSCENNSPRRPYQSSPVVQRDGIRARSLQPMKERTLRRQVYGRQWQESPSQLQSVSGYLYSFHPKAVTFIRQARTLP